MYKSILFLPILILIGAGCANATYKTDAQPAAQLEVPAEGNEVVAETVVSENGQVTIETADGGTIVLEQKVNADADAKTEDGVPVIDVVLGDATLKLDVVSNNFSFAPKTIEAKAGEKIRIMFKENTGFHTFVIDEIDLKHAIKADEALVFTAPKEPGTYAFYCDVGSHRAQGMEGTLLVK